MHFILLGLFAASDPNIAVNLATAKVAAGNLIGATGRYKFIVTNLIPVILGNIVGAALFVAALYWHVYAHGSLCTQAQTKIKTPKQ